MRILLRSKLMPFSHLPGIECLVPFSQFSVQIYPALIKLHSLNENITEEIPLHIQGPVRDFTVIQNLEKGEIQVFMEANQGFYRYSISYSGFLTVHLKKIPEGIFFLKDPKYIKTGISQIIPSSLERLHLGFNKALEWELVKKRGNLNEIFPLWHRLGQITPQTAFIPDNSLLSACCDAIAQRDKQNIFPLFKNLFLTGFQGLFVPREKDLDYQGISIPPIENNHPLAILSEGQKLIRSIFLETNADILELLPVLPREIVSGKLTNYQCPYGIIDLEWAQRQPRKLIVRPSQNVSTELIFPKGIRSARIRLSEKDKGYRIDSKTLFNFEQNKIYFFDQFQK